MTIELKTPEAPATSKQLWLLHILTKTDTRNLNITMLEASKRIEELKHTPIIKSDTARAEYRISGIKPIPDKSLPERVIVQGDSPTGETNMAAINAHFMANAYQLGRDKAGNDKADIGFYDFQCKECLFGKMGICEPSWREAGFMTGGGLTEPLRVESVSFDCNNHEPVRYSISEYCHRPKGVQCHRKHVDNKCLECNYRKPLFRDGYNHSAWGSYIPTMPERVKSQEFWVKQFTESSNTEGLDKTNTIIRLLNKIGGI